MLNATVNKYSMISLKDFPLERTRIIRGTPTSKIWVNAQTEDKRVTQGVWKCTSGTFKWGFSDDEFAMVLEGRALITPEEGRPFTIAAGDFVHFPFGLRTTWDVPDYIQTTFTVRSPLPIAL